MKRIIFSLVAMLTLLVAAGCEENLPGTNTPTVEDKALTREQAAQRVAELLNEVQWTQNMAQRRANVSLSKTNLMSTLPDIDEYPIVVGANDSGAQTVEIFVSTEKSGDGTDGWMREAAEDFNRQNEAGSGTQAKVKIRKIASGTGFQFIASKKYTPQAYSPSNHLWIQMVKAHGVKVEPVRERTVGNVAGIVMKKSVASTLRETYPELSVSDVIDAVVQGRLVMGYTNPYASSTGLNFLVSVLHAFSDGNPTAMLSPEVVSAFEGFQRGVPYVAMTTLQMRDSVQNNGVLDAFVMEHQTFAKTNPPMSAEYEFIPFGMRHDNPLYAIGELGDEQKAVLEAFAQHLEAKKLKEQAAEYGFNAVDDYASAYDALPGRTLVDAQQLWKDKKDAGRPITAIFLADVSGSMRGSRLKQLQRALIEGSDFIATGNSIGLVTFNDVVNVSLPPKKFDLLQKSAFHAAVEDLDAAGGTAMYNGVIVSLSLLLDAIKSNPDTKPILFVLTDGQTNKGLEFESADDAVQGLGIPVYTIGYEAQIKELKRLSGLVEAVSRDAGEGNVSYEIGSLLNAQM